MGIKELLSGDLKEKFKELTFGQEASVQGVSDIVQPVIELNKDYVNVVKSGLINSTTPATLYTTPTDEDFFLDGFYTSLVKDSTEDLNFVALTCVINGETVNIAFIVGLAGQEQNVANVVPLQNPIKVDRGTNIQLTSTGHSLGSFFFGGSIYGHKKSSIKK